MHVAWTENYWTKKPTVRRLLARGCGSAAGCLAFCISTHCLGAAELDEIAATQLICERSPESRVASAQRLRGPAAERAAGVLPNPSLVVQHQQNLDGPTDRETVLGLAVPLAIGGRRSLAKDAARARSEQGLFRSHATLLSAALSFREAYVAAAGHEARVQVLTRGQRELEALTETIKGLAKGGEAAGYDLLRQQTQARAHRRLLTQADARARAARALLQSWLGVPLKVRPLDLAAVRRNTTVPDARSAVALGQHPQIRDLEASARASALDARAAERRWVPELEVFGGYRRVDAADATGHGFSAGLTVPLTFFDHGQGVAAQALAEGAVARASAERLRRRHQAAFASARAELLALSVDDEDTDPTELRRKARKLYLAGEASITELLDAFRTAEDAELGRVDVAEQIARARLSLMRAAGTQLNAKLDRQCSGVRGAQ